MPNACSPGWPPKPTLPSSVMMSPPACHTGGQMRHTVSSSPTAGHAVPNVPFDLSVSCFEVAANCSHVQPSAGGSGTPICLNSFLL